MSKDTGIKDLQGNIIFEDSIIGLRFKDSNEYTDKVVPVWNKDRQLYEFESTYQYSVYNTDKPLKYLCWQDLYGWITTFEVINNSTKGVIL